jgi:hypothetical protein
LRFFRFKNSSTFAHKMHTARAFAAVALATASITLAQGGNGTLFPYNGVPAELEIYFAPSQHLVKTGELVGINSMLYLTFR